jgi:hypothetical protein
MLLQTAQRQEEGQAATGQDQLLRYLPGHRMATHNRAPTELIAATTSRVTRRWDVMPGTDRYRPSQTGPAAVNRSMSYCHSTADRKALL